jgi:hypothetical protein
MEEIKRYNFESAMKWHNQDTGKYVKYEDHQSELKKAKERIANYERKEIQIIGDLNELHTIAHKQNNRGAKYEIKRCMKIIQVIYSKQDT